MIIEPVNHRRIRIILYPADLKYLKISRTDLLTGSPALGTALQNLLMLISIHTGLFLSERQLLIEVCPSDRDEYVLYFSALEEPPAHDRPRRESLAPGLFRFPEADSLISGCRAVYKLMSHRIFSSTLYWDSAFILSVCPLDPPPSRVWTLLAEYADMLGHGHLLEAILSEHAQLLRSGDAIDIIAAP